MQITDGITNQLARSNCSLILIVRISCFQILPLIPKYPLCFISKAQFKETKNQIQVIDFNEIFSLKTVSCTTTYFSDVFSWTLDFTRKGFTNMLSF